MALNLAVKEGSAVYIDGEPLYVRKVTLPDPDEELGWQVEVETRGGARFELYEDREVEIFPNVYIQLGLKNQIGMASLVFEAPRTVVILTEKNYRASFPTQFNGKG